jgi:AraC-like DNA-binding protein
MTPEGDLTLGGPGAVSTFLCAGFEYDHDIAHPLLALLPPVLHVPADPGARDPAGGVVSLLAAELSGRGAGSLTAVARLIDVLLIAVVRHWVRHEGAERASWLAALRDPPIAKALAALHHRPAEAWTLETLAAEVNVSRATLARRFSELEPPLASLTRWRIDIATRRLKDGDEPIDAIARSVGYSSEYAFSRAFRRHRGLPPGRFRRTAGGHAAG